MTGSSWIFVAPSGDDLAAETAPHSTPSEAAIFPLKTVQAAIGTARPGTTLMIHSGIYPENIEINGRTGSGGTTGHLRHLTAEMPLRILGVDGFTETGAPKAIITGSHPISTIFINGISHVHIHNIGIEGCKGMGSTQDQAPIKFIGGPGSVLPEEAAGHLTLAGCHISGDGVDAIKAATATHLLIEGCTFRPNVLESMIDFVSVLDSEVRHCLFEGHAKDGCSAKGASGRIVWDANIFRYSGNYSQAIGWKDPAISIGGIGWSRINRDMSMERWNIECFDSVARHNLFDGYFEHAVTLWGARNCLIEENFIGHHGAPGQRSTFRFAWRSEQAPSYPWKNQWQARSGGNAETWAEARARRPLQMRRLGYATNGANLFRNNTYRSGGNYLKGFSKNAEDPDSPNIITGNTASTDASWLEAIGAVGPPAHDPLEIYQNLSLPPP